MTIANESLPSHGASPLYAVAIGKRVAGALAHGVRISWGGHRLPTGILRYPLVATHVTVGKLTVSFVRTCWA